MKKTFLGLFLLFLTTLYADETVEEELISSTPEQLINSYLIGGVISPMGGQPVLQVQDLVIKGAQEIALNRVYIPPFISAWFPPYRECKAEHQKKDFYFNLKRNYKGWQLLPHLRLQLNSDTMIATVSDPSGVTLNYDVSHKKTLLVGDLYAINNVNGEEPHGRYDPRNLQLDFQEYGRKIVVRGKEGTLRYYIERLSGQRNPIFYYLSHELLPNGKLLKYHYDDKGALKQIDSMDSQQKYLYASLKIAGSPREGEWTFTGSTGVFAKYAYEFRSCDIAIDEKIHGFKRKERLHLSSPPLLSQVKSSFYEEEFIKYNDLFLLESYENQEECFETTHKIYGVPVHYRVHELYLPVGAHDALTPVYTIDYSPPIPKRRGGITDVKCIDGTTTRYHFSKKFFLDAIEKLAADGSLHQTKSFFWDENQRLKAVEVTSPKEGRLYRKEYLFDSWGNPVEEKFLGDLSGDGQEEQFVTTRRFSDDGKHLLLEEQNDKGYKVCYTYLPGTNLVTRKLTYDNNQIVEREFLGYDDTLNLIERVQDDGSSLEKENLTGVVERHITKYILRKTPPFLHCPEWIEERYWSKGEERLLNKRHLIYDSWGNIKEEHFYDAEGSLAYTLFKEYNEKEELLSETNSLGQQAVYTYDKKGLKTGKKNFSHRLETLTSYDKRQRKRETRELGEDGIDHRTVWKYDSLDRVTKMVDPLERVTTYGYDPLANQVSETSFPEIEGSTGCATPVKTTSTYDPFGRKQSSTDPNGHTTTYRYNAYGSVTEVCYPDGGKESFRYTKGGALAQETNRMGVTTFYIRDSLDRALKKEYFFKGEKLAEECFSYQGTYLSTHQDKGGMLHTWSYDGAGRLAKEEHGEQMTQYSYDTLSRVSTKIENGVRLTNYTYDLLDRVTEESITDINGTLLSKRSYTYDADGHLVTITRYVGDQEALERKTFDSLGRVISMKDPLDHTTTISYNEKFRNVLGQQVLATTSVDPQGVATHLIHDAFDRVVEKKLVDQERCISIEKQCYDPAANLIAQKNSNDIWTQYTYDSCNRLTDIERASGTELARNTRYTYDKTGFLQEKTKPDGTTLCYSYHPFGFRKRVYTQDGSLDLRYTYDIKGNLTAACDINQELSIQRTLDPFGNLLKEECSTGTSLEKSYDLFHRPTSLTLPKGAAIHYTYDPLYPRSVSKGAYTHRYLSYDLSGHLMEEELIGDLGKRKWEYNLKGNIVCLKTPYFSQTITYDAVNNVIEVKKDQTNTAYTYDSLRQLTSEQSPHFDTSYTYDSNYNPTTVSGIATQVNALDELLVSGPIECTYDLNGRVIQKKSPQGVTTFTYDALDRLTDVSTPNHTLHYLYDPLGRCLAKTILPENTRETYLFDGFDDIATFDTGIKELRVLGKAPGRPSSIAIQLGNSLFLPLDTFQGNTETLVDLASKQPVSHSFFSLFGQEVGSQLNPWRFASKRLDLQTSLVNYGQRHYDPELRRWLTTDPEGMRDSDNLYQYLLNNPLRYVDPEGRFVVAIPLLIGAFALGGEVAVGLAAVEMVAACTTAVLAYYCLNEVRHWFDDRGVYTSYPSEAVIEQEEKTKKKRNAPPQPDLRAEGNPHTIIEKPGREGQYTTHNGDGTYKQYRGSGKSHGDVERPNIKENKNNPSPTGLRPGNPNVREPRPDEIPAGK